MLERIKVSQNFYLDEFVDPITYLTEEDNGLSRVDYRVIQLAQLLRSLKRSSIGINNWWSHWLKHDYMSPEEFYKWVDKERGVYQSSGFRAKWCTIGASKSVHKTGGAIDPKGDVYTLYNIVEKNAELFYSFGLRRIEDPRITAGWLHMDISDRNGSGDSIRIVGRKSHVGDIKL